MDLSCCNFFFLICDDLEYLCPYPFKYHKDEETPLSSVVVSCILLDHMSVILCHRRPIVRQFIDKVQNRRCDTIDTLEA